MAHIPSKLGTCSFPVDCFLGPRKLEILAWEQDEKTSCSCRGIGIFYFLGAKKKAEKCRDKRSFSFPLFVGYISRSFQHFIVQLFEIQKFWWGFCSRNWPCPKVLGSQILAASFVRFTCHLFFPICVCSPQFTRATFAEGFLWCEALWTEAQIGACQNGSQIEVLGDVPRDLGPHDFCMYTKKLHSISYMLHMCIQMPSYLLVIYNYGVVPSFHWKNTWSHRSLGTVEKSRGFLNLAAMPKWSILCLIGPHFKHFRILRKPEVCISFCVWFSAYMYI